MQADALEAAFTAFRDRADMRALARVFDATAPNCSRSRATSPADARTPRTWSRRRS
jgi:hypothetical protein